MTYSCVDIGSIIFWIRWEVYSYDRDVVVISGGVGRSTVLIYDIFCWSGFYSFVRLFSRSICELLIGTDFCFFNNVPAVSNFVASFIVVVDGGVSRSMNLLIFVVFVLDVWCMMFTYRGFFCIRQNVFIDKKVIPIIDRYCFLIFDEFRSRIFLERYRDRYVFLCP